MLAATPLVSLCSQWRSWQLNMQRPAETQERELHWLVRKAASTRFGRDHHFASITSVQDFQNRVRRYEDIWHEYWKSDFPELNDCTWPGTIPYFALTAGTTTGVTKYIPCSRAMLDANFRAAQDLLFHHLLNRPISRILGGKARRNDKLVGRSRRLSKSRRQRSVASPGATRDFSSNRVRHHLGFRVSSI
jgi:hypothetical protein